MVAELNEDLHDEYSDEELTDDDEEETDDEEFAGEDEESEEEEEEESEEEEETDEEEESEEGEEDGESEEDDDEEKGFFADEPAPEDEDAPRDLDADAKRKTALILGVCCCCLVVVAGVLLGVLLAGGDKEPAVAPTPSPTRAPTASPTASPTAAPTVSLYPSATPTYAHEILFPVSADTTLRGGEFSGDAYGDSDTFTVQQGTTESESAVGLIEFDLNELPPEADGSRYSQVLLRLTHVVSLENQTASIQIHKVVFNETLDIEELTWDVATEDGIQASYVPFTVQSDDETIDVDISDLVRGSVAVRHERQLRGRQLETEPLYLLLVTPEGDESNLMGEEFRTREYMNGTYAPVIIHNFLTEAPSAAPSVSSSPTVTASPTVSAAPSMAPSVSMSPSVSSSPSTTPTVSKSPSLAPTAAPTSSQAPSTSPSSTPTAA